MGLSWNAIDGIMQRAVKRGLARRKKTCAQHLGVDETAFRKRHDYVSIVSDQDNGTVLYVGKDRKKADLTRIAHRFSDFGVFRRRDLSEAT